MPLALPPGHHMRLVRRTIPSSSSSTRRPTATPLKISPVVTVALKRMPPRGVPCAQTERPSAKTSDTSCRIASSSSASHFGGGTTSRVGIVRLCGASGTGSPPALAYVNAQVTGSPAFASFGSSTIRLGKRPSGWNSAARVEPSAKVSVSCASVDGGHHTSASSARSAGVEPAATASLIAGGIANSFRSAGSAGPAPPPPSRAMTAEPRSRYFARHASLGGSASSSPATKMSSASRTCASEAVPARTRHASSQPLER